MEEKGHAETTVQRWVLLKAAILDSMSEEGAKQLKADLYEMPHNVSRWRWFYDTVCV